MSGGHSHYYEDRRGGHDDRRGREDYYSRGGGGAGGGRYDRDGRRGYDSRGYSSGGGGGRGPPSLEYSRYDSGRRYHSGRRHSPPPRRDSRDDRNDHQMPLLDVLPLSQWPRKLQNWDVPPPGYEHLTPVQAKLSGLFPLASQSVRTAAPTGDAGFSGLAQSNPAAQSINALRQAKRIYVSNIPRGVTEGALGDYFNEKMRRMMRGDTAPGGAVTNVTVREEKDYAFVEFRTTKEAELALNFDGHEFRGVQLKVRRPKEHLGETQEANFSGSALLDSEHRLYVGNIPTFVTDDQLRELLEGYGKLKSFQLVKDSYGISKGSAYCEYLDIRDTENAIKELNGLEVGDNKLLVHRVNPLGSLKQSGLTKKKAYKPLMMILAVNPSEIKRSRIMEVLNMISRDDLIDNYAEESETLKEDLTDICQDFGEVEEVKILDESELGKCETTKVTISWCLAKLLVLCCF